MRSIQTTQAPTDPVALRAWLREQIHAVETGARRAHSAVPTGWEAVDGALPGGGLLRGAVHEWFGPIPDEGSSSSMRGCGAWTPALLIFCHLARCATNRGGPTPCWGAVWIGRRVWPTAYALAGDARAAALARTLLIDPRADADRLWAIDAALRCPGLVVVADGSSLDTAGTRRLQLAAEAGGSIGLIARPPHEAGRISTACTRWVVSHARSSGEHPRWTVRLVRCKGLQSMVTHGTAVVVEQTDAGVVVAVPADVGERSGATAAAS